MILSIRLLSRLIEGWVVIFVAAQVLRDFEVSLCFLRENSLLIIKIVFSTLVQIMFSTDDH